MVDLAFLVYYKMFCVFWEGRKDFRLKKHSDWFPLLSFPLKLYSVVVFGGGGGWNCQGSSV